jgi:hypothetical protein
LLPFERMFSSHNTLPNTAWKRSAKNW